MAEAKWYVAHTYSGYEDKVKANIEKALENRHLENEILEVRVPMEDVVEVKNGVRKQVQKKLFPGYVLLNMVMNDDTWYVVRNTRGVTGFVGPGSKPVPLSPGEIERLTTPASQQKVVMNIEPGDVVIVTAGAWAETTGVVSAVNQQKQTVTIQVELFGRSTPVEINFSEVKKVG